MTNREKYAHLCGAVEAIYPVLAGVWHAAYGRFGDEWLDEFVLNVETIYGELGEGVDNRMEDALDGYAEFVNDSLRNQVFFERNGRYRHSSYAECAELYYHNEDHMTRCYLPGMYLSHFLWPQHFNMLRTFRQSVLPRVGDAGLVYEVGVGCGMYSKVTLEALPNARGRGFDISQHSLNFTKGMLDTFGLGDRYEIVNQDIRHGHAEQADFLICQEVLEHLENPDEFCTWLFERVKPGGCAYITAALNAAHSDHIYLYRDPMLLERHLRDAGFQPMALMEEMAAGSKPREITPSLAGYFVLRP